MAIMSGVQWKPVNNRGGRMSGHYGLVLHVQVGNGSLYGWFNNPSSSASSTFWVPKIGTAGDVGAIEQYVDSDTVAWAQADGNATWNSVETEGYPTEPLTDYQVWGVGQIMRWLHDWYGVPYTVSDVTYVNGLGWHGMGGAAWGNHPDCPGDIRKGQRQAILDSIGGDGDLTAEEHSWLQNALLQSTQANTNAANCLLQVTQLKNELDALVAQVAKDTT